MAIEAELVSVTHQGQGSNRTCIASFKITGFSEPTHWNVAVSTTSEKDIERLERMAWRQLAAAIKQFEANISNTIEHMPKI